jgi:branched-subunit amino acid ABC-type transport system permease component
VHDAIAADDYVWAQFIDNRILPVGMAASMTGPARSRCLLAAWISGLGLGSMYGLMALGFYVTYAVSGTVNFAQGSAMMLGAVFTFTFAQTLGWPMRWPILLALALCAVYGLLVEFVAVRPFAAAAPMPG